MPLTISLATSSIAPLVIHLMVVVLSLCVLLGFPPLINICFLTSQINKIISPLSLGLSPMVHTLCVESSLTGIYRQLLGPYGLANPVNPNQSFNSPYSTNTQTSLFLLSNPQLLTKVDLLNPVEAENHQTDTRPRMIVIFSLGPSKSQMLGNKLKGFSMASNHVWA